jgi:putative aldouronate transport system permease protein
MKRTFGEKIFNSTNYLILGILGISCILPMLNILSTSLSDYHNVISGNVTLFPIGFTFGAYVTFFEGGRALSALVNSIILLVIGVPLSLVATIMGAYPLSRQYFAGRRVMMMMIVISMMFNPGLIPNFLVVKSLGLIDSYWSIWLPGLIGTFNLIIMKSFFENIPEELFESARMDGCGEWRMMWQIVVPLSMSVIATVTLFYVVASWNTFQPVLLYINNTKKQNLPVLVQQMINSQQFMQEMNYQHQEEMQYVTPQSVRTAGVVIMILPMMIIYPFLQKYFIKGVMIGAIKG